MGGRALISLCFALPSALFLLYEPNGDNTGLGGAAVILTLIFLVIFLLGLVLLEICLMPKVLRFFGKKEKPYPPMPNSD